MTARTTLKRAIGSVALAPGVESRTRRALRERLNVVYLHYVGEVRPYCAEFYLGPTLEQLDAQLTMLGRYFKFCSLREIVSGAAPNGVPRLAVTFDDGFDLVGNGAVDVLERHGVEATVFVVTFAVDNRNLMWRHKLSAIRTLCDESTYLPKYNELMRRYGLATVADADALMPSSESWPMEHKEELGDELWAICDMPPMDAFLDEQRPYFTWDGLREWVLRGHGVGLHTRTHPFCSRLDAPAVEEEIVEPAALLRGTLDLDFLPFSYPFGVRLDAATELDLYKRGVFDCAFGIDGFAPRGTAPFRLERACMEGELAYHVFGKALLGRPRT
jgi:peptidoglycan/xylan/chitin deacetylase (PgdA/CDA1 family)